VAILKSRVFAILGWGEFRKLNAEIHGHPLPSPRSNSAPLAKALPGLRSYKQNHVMQDGKRKHPGWDAIIELYFDNRESMEAAWSSPQGKASDADLPAFADLARTTWSIVEELTLLE
jgi:uncharacterized protein (TIGR02118 family)